MTQTQRDILYKSKDSSTPSLNASFKYVLEDLHNTAQMFTLGKKR